MSSDRRLQEILMRVPLPEINLVKFHENVRILQAKRRPTEMGHSAENQRAAAEFLASLGRGGDTELVHVNKGEEQMLKAAGGSGTINPQTGLREYSFENDQDLINFIPQIQQAFPLLNNKEDFNSEMQSISDFIKGNLGRGEKEPDEQDLNLL